MTIWRRKALHFANRRLFDSAVWWCRAYSTGCESVKLSYKGNDHPREAAASTSLAIIIGQIAVAYILGYFSQQWCGHVRALNYRLLVRGFNLYLPLNCSNRSKSTKFGSRIQCMAKAWGRKGVITILFRSHFPNRIQNSRQKLNGRQNLKWPIRNKK